MSSSSWVQIRCLHSRGSDWLRAHLPLRERILRVIKRAITMTILIALMATLGRSWRSTFGNAGSFCQWRNELCAGKPLRNREATAREGSAPDRNRTRGLRLRRPTPGANNRPFYNESRMLRTLCFAKRSATSADQTPNLRNRAHRRLRRQSSGSRWSIRRSASMPSSRLSLPSSSTCIPQPIR